MRGSGGEVSLILGIETSCDDTGAAVVGADMGVRANVVGSQEIVHRRHGGVVPELASRRHSENIIPVIDAAVEEAGVRLADIDLVAVTRGPGLVGSLLVGFVAAKGLAWSLGCPFVGVNHVAAHLWAAVLDSGHPQLPSPAVCLIVSGGHTELIHYRDGRGFYLGGTRDDAAGEAYDKVARLLGLGFPGGPAVDRLAASYRGPLLELPRPMMDSGDFDFSFSGLKTAVALAAESDRDAAGEPNAPRLAASFQAAAVDVLVTKTLAAAERVGAEHLVMAGGVAANSLLRERVEREAPRRGLGLCVPPIHYCTDNAAMVAAAGYRRFGLLGADSLSMDVDPSLGVRRDGGGFDL